MIHTSHQSSFGLFMSYLHFRFNNTGNPAYVKNYFCDLGDEVTFYTDANQEFYTTGYYTVLDAYELVFWIRGSGDARIALTTVAGVTSVRSVEIQIGKDNNAV